MLMLSPAVERYLERHGLNNPNIRKFSSLEEVKANLDTITFEECHRVNILYGITFELNQGVIVDAYQDAVPEGELLLD